MPHKRDLQNMFYMENRPLSIAFLTDAFPKASETFISRKFQFLLDHGHNVHVFCGRHDRGIEVDKGWKRRIHEVPAHHVHRSHLLPAVLRYVAGMGRGTVYPASVVQLRTHAKEVGASLLASLVNISRLLGVRWDIVHAHFLTSLNPSPCQHSMFTGAIYCPQCCVM